MKKSHLGVGTFGGLCIGISSIAIACVLFVFRRLGITLDTITHLGIVMISAKSLGLYLFYRAFDKASRANPDLSYLSQWTRFLNSDLLSHPNVIIAIAASVSESFMEALIIYKTAQIINPILVCIVYLICQAIGASVQGTISDIFSRKKTLMFSLLSGTFAMLVMSPIAGDSIDFTQPIIIFGDFAMSSTTVAFLALGIKGLCSNLLALSIGIVFELLCIKAREASKVKVKNR